MKLLGRPVIIAKAGVPQVKLVPLDMPMTKGKMRTLKNSINIPDNFEQAFDSEIAEYSMKAVCNVFTRYSCTDLIFY